MSFGKGREKRVRMVLVDRGHPARSRRAAQRMAAEGRPASWIAAALGVDAGTVSVLLAADPIWGTSMSEVGR